MLNFMINWNVRRYLRGNLSRQMGHLHIFSSLYKTRSLQMTKETTINI